jgi:hypothetical protein
MVRMDNPIAVMRDLIEKMPDQPLKERMRQIVDQLEHERTMNREAVSEAIKGLSRP